MRMIGNYIRSLSLRAFLTLLPVILFSGICKAQYNENLIKAVYIERITRFIEWPEKNKSMYDDRFVIGVYKENDFYKTLSEVFKDKPIKDHKVIVILINSPDLISSCNLCYISEAARPDLKKFVDIANSSGVLLVSGTTDFCKEGIHVNFYLEDEKLKFELNETSLSSAGLKVSYLLMQNSRIIK